MAGRVDDDFMSTGYHGRVIVSVPMAVAVLVQVSLTDPPERAAMSAMVSRSPSCQALS